MHIQKVFRNFTKGPIISTANPNEQKPRNITMYIPAFDSIDSEILPKIKTVADPQTAK